MKPSKITITNLRDDEPDMSFNAEYTAPEDAITGLLANAAVINRRCELSLENFIQVAIQCYNESTGSDYKEEMMPNDQ
ncbi:hypothetical protein [Levilactobacillus brevis]|uniref:hypothetical protein n=1 Tax=Levilactobacillus brevis TaxID=1580 RepID=UPI000BE9A054|nr:hypothetical protein [Levilactobacillus brevis]MCT3574140.1 hypothetical protein [Levilactobacillus brevis]STX19325.1 Uncharacterised protein [Levilactobacillus brevis]